MTANLPDGLSDGDQLALFIGRVAQMHVFMDSALISLHQTLSGNGSAMILASQGSTNTRIEGCRAMLKIQPLAEDHVALGMDVLNAAKQANERRNRVVHDMWMPELDKDGQSLSRQWVSARLNPRKFPLGYAGSGDPTAIDKLADDLALIERASARVVVFDQVLTFYLGPDAWPRPGAESADTGMPLDEMLRQLRDG